MLLLRIGRSKKGWITGEISAEWIKQFDELTCKKVPRQSWLLLVDGHCSHYTYEFLNYAHAHDIHVLCYPSHATHVFQGLDVICFALLKRFFEEECRKFESQGHGVVKKEHFLSVYSKAHVCAFTVDVVKSAFEKTGVVPYNPNAIDTAEFKCSLETSNVRSGLLLLQDIEPPTPICIVKKMFQDASRSRPSTHSSSLAPSCSSSHPPSCGITLGPTQSSSVVQTQGATPDALDAEATGVSTDPDVDKLTEGRS